MSFNEPHLVCAVGRLGRPLDGQLNQKLWRNLPEGRENIKQVDGHKHRQTRTNKKNTAEWYSTKRADEVEANLKYPPLN